MENKQAIKAIYSELQGYLAQAPDEKSYDITEEEFWNQFNVTIIELNKVTGKDYDKFKLKPLIIRENGIQYMPIKIYRQKLGGLIARLYGEYFSDETPPFANMPTTIITQSQNQNQSLQVQLLLDVNDLINKKLGTVPEGSKEKTFLEEVKASLSSVKNISQLVTLLISTAHQLGITIEQLKTLFS